MKGRPPKPTDLRVIEGNRGKRVTETLEPEPTPIDDDAPPAHFDHWAREMWARLFKELSGKVGLTALDRPKLEMFCECYSRYRLADDALWATVKDPATGVETTVRSYVYVTHGRNGKQIKTRPELNQLHEELRLMNSMGAEFGLSPAARVRLRGLAQGDLLDELDKLENQYGARERAR